MKRISISVRIAICLALLSLCAILIARVAGLLPDARRIRMQGRIALCESLAINCSLLANREDVRGIEQNLEAFVRRNQDVKSAALRTAGGDVAVKVGDHAAFWNGTADHRSTSSNIYVPITTGNEHWGDIEVAFDPLSDAGGLPLLSPFAEFALFVTCFNAIVFIFWLRRVLVHLDPARVMPQRVRTALDTLAEGLLVLDKSGRIMMANKAFSERSSKRPKRCRAGWPLSYRGCNATIRQSCRGMRRWLPVMPKLAFR